MKRNDNVIEQHVHRQELYELRTGSEHRYRHPYRMRRAYQGQRKCRPNRYHALVLLKGGTGRSGSERRRNRKRNGMAACRRRNPERYDLSRIRNFQPARSFSHSRRRRLKIDNSGLRIRRRRRNRHGKLRKRRRMPHLRGSGKPYVLGNDGELFRNERDGWRSNAGRSRRRRRRIVRVHLRRNAFRKRFPYGHRRKRRSVRMRRSDYLSWWRRMKHSRERFRMRRRNMNLRSRSERAGIDYKKYFLRIKWQSTTYPDTSGSSRRKSATKTSDTRPSTNGTYRPARRRKHHQR